MKRKLLLAVLLSAFLLLPLSFAGAQSIENELYLITPVSKDVHDPALKRNLPPMPRRNGTLM